MTIDGLWWLAGKEGDAIPGILSYTPEGGQSLVIKDHRPRSIVEVLNSLCVPEGKPLAPSVMFGRDSQNNPVTLHRCAEIGSSESQGLASKTFLVQEAFLGAHISNPPNEIFHSVQVDLDFLYRWLALSPKQSGRFDEDTWTAIQTFTIEPPIEIDLGDCGLLSLRTFLAPSSEQNTNSGQYSLHHTSNAWWQFHEPIPFSEIESRLLALIRLISIFVQRPIFMRSCTLMDDQKRVKQDSAPSELPRHVALLRPRFRSPDDLRDPWPTSFIVPFCEVRDNLPKYIARWMAYGRKYDMVLNLYFTELYARNMPGEVRFLLLAQALEVYHRTSNPEDIHFAVRLNEIVSRHASLLAPIIADVNDFCLRVKNARNRFTHWGAVKPQDIADNHLPAYLERMRRVLTTSILSDLAVQGNWTDRLIQPPLPQVIVYS